jgi:hypothetical protein
MIGLYISACGSGGFAGLKDTPTPTSTATSTPTSLPTATMTRVPTQTPYKILSGDWSATLSYDREGEKHTYEFVFTVSKDARSIELWSLSESTAGAINYFADISPIEIHNNLFVIRTIRIDISGVFTASNAVAGAFTFKYENNNDYSGQWTGAPK